MMSSCTVIKNCRLPEDPGQTTSVLIDGTKITAIGPDIEISAQCTQIDAQSNYVVPGFIDVHIQGAGGADVLDSTEDALRAMSTACARYGVTGFLATTVYFPGGANEHLQVAAQCTGKDLGGARLLGTHLEGPFISLQKRGMIQPSCICEPSQKILDDILALCDGTLRMMTIAPELDNGLPVVESLINSSVIASLGHTRATYDQTLRSFDAGVNHVTHLFNAMPSIHHRDPGPFPAIVESPQVTVQVITDGVHLHESIIRMAYESIGPDRFVTITDGMQAIGLPEGSYIYNNIPYESKNGTARYHDGTLIGTALGLSELLLRLHKFTGCSLPDAIATGTTVPSRVLSTDKVNGSVALGKDADIVIMSTDFEVLATFVQGKIVYRKGTL